MISWLKGLLGLDWPSSVDGALEAQQAQLDEMGRRLGILEQWVGNLDSALWRIEQKQRGTGASEPEPMLTDLKALSEKIKDEMTQRKARFPTKLEELT